MGLCCQSLPRVRLPTCRHRVMPCPHPQHSLSSETWAPKASSTTPSALFPLHMTAPQICEDCARLWSVLAGMINLAELASL